MATSKVKNENINPQYKLTSWEWKGIGQKYNIADGHAHQGQNLNYLKIIKNLPNLYLQAEKGKQKEIQSKFEQIFFKLAGQKSYKKLQPPLYQYACSLSIEAVANYLRLTNKATALLHPTFDNLADILKRHKIPLTPLKEEDVLHPEQKLNNLKADALFLVCPNNPTGFELTKKQFIAMVEYCRKYNKLLILDYSFRFYSSHTKWDQYKILSESGIDFIILEDTGKTWPTLELKVSIILASDSVYPYLLDINNDFLLNVSPFIFTLLTEYINTEGKQKSHSDPQKNIEVNRKKLEETLKGSALKVTNPHSKLSVAWIKLPNNWTATLFCKWLSKYGVFILPGGPFFWDNQLLGESYIRVALQRPEKKFSEAISLLKKATLAFSQQA